MARGGRKPEGAVTELCAEKETARPDSGQALGSRGGVRALYVCTSMHVSAEINRTPIGSCHNQMYLHQQHSVTILNQSGLQF